MSSSNRHLRILPLVVAVPLFLQNVDTLVMTTALPTIASALQVRVLDLNLAITAYLLSLAVFLPASAWLVDRFGAKRVFCAAMLLFSLGSALCGLAQNLGQLIVFRLVQGIGGSMMVPVGRAILLRSVPSVDLVRAMIWFTIPGAVGRLAGPLVGGAIVTMTSWRWIFLVNIPFGLLGVALGLWAIDQDPAPEQRPPARFDLPGLTLLAGSLAGLLGGLELAGKDIVPGPVVAAMLAGGVLALYVYARRSRTLEHPILDFGVLRFATYRITVLGGFPIRVAIGAAPFLLPLMLQIGFGLSPLESGVLTMAMALGALSTRAAIAPVIRVMGFRPLLIASAALAGLFYAAYGLFTPETSRPLMFCALLLGGICTSVTMVTLNTLGYSDIPAARTGHATAMSAMAQQLSTAVGVVLGASLVSFFSFVHGGGAGTLRAADFPPAFAAVALLAILSALAFRRLRPEDGDELRGLRPAHSGAVD